MTCSYTVYMTFSCNFFRAVKEINNTSLFHVCALAVPFQASVLFKDKSSICHFKNTCTQICNDMYKCTIKHAYIIDYMYMGGTLMRNTSIVTQCANNYPFTNSTYTCMYMLKTYTCVNTLQFTL